ncbi:unnamed protein product (macronuclear) [Paramecium tetraurelia]|uniref:Transmembrane protein n=1 Tax=Paramecium tetraurelia TaxID=5888 RepID=A0CR32_PARTE|nr:uncharacterized protein GSPATT00009562001 [Paramecium tetraurelia]CAK73249.1 unnamed protein product [Paramecium tetraurelia]|eukprot:XP_001440646.1 hypothetical protein (macronuclear) [Paramecium tetraurelia strain d4-2]
MQHLPSVSPLMYKQHKPSKMQHCSKIIGRYDLEENMCLEIDQRNLGCSSNLNKEACIYQLTDEKGQDVNCRNLYILGIFLERCRLINDVQLQTLSCSDRINKLACMNLPQKVCVWNNSCKNLDDNSNLNQCYASNLPVTPYTCQQSQSDLCMSSWKHGNFRCLEVPIDQLNTITCNQMGLNQKACIAIKTIDQKCIFENKRCSSIEPSQITSCDLKLNINACLSSNQNNELQCEWFESSCRVFQSKEGDCPTRGIVNSSVCSNSKGACMYNGKEKICQKIQRDTLHSLKCNTIGLSKKGCLLVKNKNCCFYGGKCQELNEQDLKNYLCEMDLNEQACVNLETEFQYCQWNGNNCERIFMNQDIDCPLKFNNDLMKVNGNVCQAISKSNVLCKYDKNTNLCVASTNYDECETPFLNFLGCISIQKHHQTCQWYQNKCRFIIIQQNSTLCETLKSVNAQSCSQVYESNSIGCYYDQNSYQCKSVSIDSNQQILNIIQELYTISCKDLSLGINKVLCASLTTPSTPCRWHQDQCSYIKQRKDIANVLCMDLQHANYQACALAQYNNEPCIYSYEQKGCSNNLKKETDCKTDGLNAIGCEQIKKNCYFDKVSCIVKQEIDFIPVVANLNDYQIIRPNYYDSEECKSIYLTKLACSSITKKGQTCIWSFKLNTCTETSITYNEKCFAYSGASVIINPNVCASILSDVSTFCTFDGKTKNCKIPLKIDCNTKCCTEYNLIGINAHLCSRFSDQTKGVYCYFRDQRCQELKVETVDISDQYKVKKYYNDLKLPCSSMNRNSCHMIEWSTNQLCYHNGEVCNNLNFQLYSNLTIFTQEPSQLNKFACLAIEATESALNKLKYFTYNSTNLRCQEFQVNSEYNISKCEDANGNKNICTRYTKNNWCKWDPDALQCKTIKDDVFDEFYDCNSNVNLKACVENKISNCFFTYQNDTCLEYTQDVNPILLNYDWQGSFQVCKCINAVGQKWRYSEEKKNCIKSDETFEDYNCDISKFSGNNRYCYDNTIGQCRWDSANLICYQNGTEISELNCDDYLNKVLCLKVTKEGCMWNDKEYQCQIFQYDPNALKDSYKLINEKACLSIQDAAYYYKRENNECQKFKDYQSRSGCTNYQMNKYACLVYTQGYLCFYDQNESIPNNFCKYFNDQQFACAPKFGNYINIEVCRNLPVSCYFNAITLECKELETSQQQYNLSDFQKEKQYPNKIAFASYIYKQTDPIDYNLTYQFGGLCQLENNCYFVGNNSWTYEFSSDYQEQKKNPYIQISIEWIQINMFCKKQIIKFQLEQQFITYEQNQQKFCIKNTTYISEEMFCYNSSDTITEVYEELDDDADSTYVSIYTSQLNNTQTTAERNQNLSFSKELCLNFKKEEYFFDLKQGGCIQLKNNEHNSPQLNEEDCSNQYSLCYEVTEFVEYNKEKVCGYVDQACKFKDNKCEDATHSTCTELIDLIVSQQACIRCKDQPMKYNTTKQKCEPIYKTINQSCLSQSKGIKCKWKWNKTSKCKGKKFEFECQNIEDKDLDLLDCAILNEDACKEKQYNLCWFNQETKLCMKYNPFKGECQSFKNKQTCIQSMVESCIWTSDTCQIASEQQQCDGLNKFGCLNCQSQSCVWFDNSHKCVQAIFFDQPKNCTDLQQSGISHVNALTCTSMKTQKPCILSKNYKCREIIEPILYQCETVGLNKYACILNTKNKCAFLNNKCITIHTQKEGCKNNLNQNACLNQEEQCIFQGGKCESPNFMPINQLLQEQYATYSSSFCKQIDSDAYVYSDIQKKCVKAENLDTNLTDCSFPGINKQACLNQIKSFCEYKNNQCQKIDKIQIDSCSKQKLNKFACTQVDRISCKFENNECLEVKKDEQFDCKSLQLNVNEKICSYLTESCFYDNKNRVCVKADPDEQEKCEGLNFEACINDSNKLLCEFNKSENKCESSYGYSFCDDQVNKNKCLAITTKGQFCRFEKKKCQKIDITGIKCETQFQTNPITCSKIEDKEACFYDKFEKMCKIYKQYCDNVTCFSHQRFYQNYQLSNIDSFNKNTCVQFQEAISYNPKDLQITKLPVRLLWNDGCAEVKNIQLLYLRCDDYVNIYTCVSILTPKQYCYFKDNKCLNAKLTDFEDKQCDEIININSGVFCAQQSGNPCRFNQLLHKCESFMDNKIACVEENPEKKGYNEAACQLDSENCIFSDQCYKVKKDQLQFCQNALDQEQCSRVLIEGCKSTDNICLKIQDSEYNELKCEDVVNRIGCVNIQTQDQYCQFKESKCVSYTIQKSSYMYFQSSISSKISAQCEMFQNVNHYRFCELTTDLGCMYDFQLNSCKVVPENQYLICQRGINKIACLQQTDNNLKCQFLDYCQDSDSGIQNCQFSDKNLCCKLAATKENCLIQNIYQCQWQNNECQSYQENENKECDRIKFSSLSVCISVEDKFCKFDKDSDSCISFNPNSCDELQSLSQCKRMSTLPCIWPDDKQDKKQCIQMVDQQTSGSLQLSCQDVKVQSGNLKACMNVKLQGQMCIFKDHQCETFQQTNENNCLDNININSCLQQTKSDCYWNLKVNFGEQCQAFQDFDKNDCSKNLSYTSCLKISKEGVFCIWKNQQCQEINDDQLIVYKPSSFTQINVNVCGLINNGDKVQYDKNIYQCVKVQDIRKLSCSTEGLNKEACLNIEKQECLWDVANRKCIKYIFNPQLKTCKILNVSSQSCTQINVQEACGFVKNRCDKVDLKQVKCNSDGLNKYACLNVEEYPCIWIKNSNDVKYHCEDFIPSTPCEQVPKDVNSKVCTLVQEDSCYYNKDKSKCEVPNQNHTDCELVGLNSIGCVQIENCFFKQKCQLFQKNSYASYKCDDFPVANKLICKNAADSCKYNEIQYGCSSANNELCSNDSLSIEACKHQQQCVHKDQSCQCKYGTQPGQEIKENADCEQFKCENLEEKLCLNNGECCKFEKVCKKKQCYDLTQQQCIKNDCDWNNIKESCIDIIECEQFQDQDLCNRQQFQKRQCQWVEMKGKQICVQNKCHNLEKNQICTGSRVAQQTCVEMRQGICASCEEISDSCECLRQSDYCQYDNRKCTSKKCNQYSKELQCPFEFCIFQEKCQTKCEIITDKFNCKQEENCEWIESIYRCNMKCIIIKKSEICDQIYYCQWDDVGKQCLQDFKNEQVTISIFIGTKMIFPIFALISFILI